MHVATHDMLKYLLMLTDIDVNTNTPILICNTNRLESDLKQRLSNSDITVMYALQCEITLDVVAIILMEEATYMLVWTSSGDIHTQKHDFLPISISE